MFNWTTTTLINELPENFIKNFGDDKLRIGKHLFERRWVESIRKAKGNKPVICSAELDLTAVKTLLDSANATVARLYIYVSLDGSEESIYANDLYRKGMPLSVSFTNDTAVNMAKAIVDTVNRFNIFTKVKKVLEVKENEGILTIEGTHEHQRLQKIQILTDAGFGEETILVDYEMNHKPATNYVKNVVIGKNGFGTYSQLLKDLRLPTVVNNNWLSVQKDEMPIVGALYTQYIITYYAPSTSNPSFTAIGNRSMSETTHVFWVKSDSDLITNWENFLKKIDPDKDNTLETEEVVKEGSDIFVNEHPSLVE